MIGSPERKKKELTVTFHTLFKNVIFEVFSVSFFQKPESDFVLNLRKCKFLTVRAKLPEIYGRRNIGNDG